METLVLIVVGVVIGFFAGQLLRDHLSAQKMEAAREKAKMIVEAAETKADSLLREAQLEAKDRLLKMKSEFDDQAAKERNELRNFEKRLFQIEENLNRKSEQLELKIKENERLEGELKNKISAAENKEKEYLGLIDEQRQKLEQISAMTSEEAKELLIQSMENEARHDSAKMVKRIVAEARENADKEAKKILATAIQRYAGDFVAERTVSVVHLPDDAMKGRIIGREGRNIRALEAATGIDLIIDDTPEAVILSGFNPVRREIARLSLMRLIEDGRIHPARIEDVVKKVEQEVDADIKEAGTQAAFDLGVHGIHHELIKYIGRLKFRTSYAQNVLQHSVEVGFLCGAMAAELGLNVKLAKRMGFLHDIGKSVDYEMDGSHAEIGARIAKKYGESPKVVHAIAAHHEEIEPESVYDLLVQAADSLSGARPGARKELMENYIKRLEDLEHIATDFPGVVNAYAIQAGRELRVIVEGGKISDDDAVLLSKDIVKKVENTLTFPGQIKVVVIRETRAIEYANK